MQKKFEFMAKSTDNWQRIDAVIKWANMTTNYFARYIGLTRSENLYQIKRGNNGISLDLAQRISGKFPEINIGWLMSGCGEMFGRESTYGGQIPFYEEDVERAVAQVENLSPKYYILLPRDIGCEFAMVYNGHAMGGALPAGSVVYLKKIAIADIITDREYVIVGKNFVTLRRIRLHGDAGRLSLVAADAADYSPMEIGTDDVAMLYEVKAKLIINS